jgi:hypothetical protein
MRLIVALMILGILLFITPVVRAAEPLADQLPANTLFYLGYNGGPDLQQQYNQSNLKSINDAVGLPALINTAYQHLLQHASRQDSQSLQQAWQLLNLTGEHQTALSFSMLPADNPSQFNVLILLAIRGGGDTAQITSLMQSLADQADAQPADSNSDGKITVYQQGDVTVMQMFVQQDSKFNKETFAALANKEYFGASDESGSLSVSPNFVAAMQPLQSDPALSVYVDAQGIIALIQQTIASQSVPSDLVQFDMAKKLYGLDSFKWLAYTGGFNGADWQSDYFLGADKITSPFLQMYLSSQVLMDKDYQLVPESSGLVVLNSVNLDHYLDNIARAASWGDPQAQQRFQTQIAQINASWGLDLQKDLLSPLTGTWASYQPIDANGTLSDPVFVHPLSDDAAFSATLAKVFAQLNAVIQQSGAPMAITHLTSENVPYDALALPVPGIAPTVVVYQGKLFFSFSTQAALAAANANFSANPFSTNPDLLAIEQKLGVPRDSLHMIEFIESKPVVSAVLAYAQQTVLPILQQQNLIPANYQLPPIEKTLPYLTPYAGFMWSDGTGVHIMELTPAPGAILLIGKVEFLTNIIGPTLPAMILPSIIRAREQSRRVVSMSNERQITMGCLIYANDHQGRFPQSLGEIIAGGYLGQSYSVARIFIDPSSGSTPLVIPPEHAQDAAWIDANLTGHCDFVYVGEGMNATTMSNAASTVVVYEPLSVSGGQGSCVGYADGHVEWVTLDRFAQVTAWPAEK